MTDSCSGPCYGLADISSARQMTQYFPSRTIPFPSPQDRFIFSPSFTVMGRIPKRAMATRHDSFPFPPAKQGPGENNERGNGGDQKS